MAIFGPNVVQYKIADSNGHVRLQGCGSVGYTLLTSSQTRIPHYGFLPSAVLRCSHVDLYVSSPSGRADNRVVEDRSEVRPLRVLAWGVGHEVESCTSCREHHRKTRRSKLLVDRDSEV